jgi:predicted TIM-barrel fold metal-dependent hydrolase
MDKNDYVLISVDDHIVEPPDMWDGRLPKKYQDKAPKMITRADGASVWMYEGHEVETFAVNAVAGRPQEEWGFEPQSYDDLRPGCYDVHARVKDMSANGVWASQNFSTFVQFPGTLFAVFAHRDPAQATEMIRAYNDWHLEAWCAEYPDRFIPLCLVPVHDVDAMVREVRRVKEKGCHAVSFMGTPYPFPSLYTDHWDPFFNECSELDVKVCMHLGAGASVLNMVGEVEDAPPLPEPEPVRRGLKFVGISVYEGMPAAVAADLMNSHLFERFPKLKIALSEGGIGWIPYFLEVADTRVRHHGPWTGLSFGDRKPSEIFLEHVFGCFIEDRAGINNRDLLNIDMIGWESDYPHSDGLWPDSPEILEPSLRGVPDDIVEKVTHRNAMDFFHFDPFINRTRDQCTVSALRAEVADWDISIESAFVRRPSENAIFKHMHAPKLPAPVSSTK